jgi:23S rRNA pseudouridine1911/1915/1917 synthase
MTAGPSKRVFSVDEHMHGVRLDRFLKGRLPGIPRRLLIDWIGRGLVTVREGPARKGMALQAGDRVEVVAPFSGDAMEVVTPDPDVPIEILFEDSDLVAVSKPAGIPTHPLRAGERGTVANALLCRYPEMHSIGFSWREPGILHRLDKDTSGVVLAARTQLSFENLRVQNREGTMLKKYVALVHGRLEQQGGEIDRPIVSRGRRSSRVRVATGAGGGRVRGRRECRTHYRCIAHFEKYTLVRVSICRGARHQIRCHLAHIGHPIVGDPLYGGPFEPGLLRRASPRLMLHADSVHLRHPSTGTPLKIACPCPHDFDSTLAALCRPIS